MPQLDQIKHIVVLMLENRSFDHMLGYLRLENVLPVNGLTGAEANEHGGVTYKPTHLTDTIFDVDPHHAWDDVHEQVAGGNAGFVKNFAKVARTDLGRIMGYHNAAEVPIFDLLAKQYCVCDNWHAPVAGPTQPNRFYAIAGTSEGRKANATPPTLTARTVFHELTDRGVGQPTIGARGPQVVATPDQRRADPSPHPREHLPARQPHVSSIARHPRPGGENR